MPDAIQQTRPDFIPAAPVIEAVGTGALILAIVGTGIMASQLTDSMAMALLAASIVTAGMLYVLITVLGPLSGAHLNPAVTLALALNGAITPGRAAVYAVAQVIGGAAGTLTAHALFDLPLFQVGRVVRAGPNLWLSEALATFGLVAVILLALRGRAQSIPALVGAYVMGAYWFTSSTGFANPAVTIARALTASSPGILPVNAPAYVTAQLVGAVAAALLIRRLPRG